MYKLAVFDLDGTLLDTRPDLLPAFNAAVEAYGFAPCRPENFGRVIGNGFRTSLRRILPKDFNNEEQFADMCRIYHEIYSVHYADNTYPYDGMHETLHDLRTQGIKLAVLSNKAEEHTIILCEKLFPDIEFCRICGGGSGYPLKPDPSFLKHILTTQNVGSEEAIFIGDSDVDVYTAHNAGMHCIGCEWGYRGKEELKSAGADFMVRTPQELLTII